MSVDGRFYVNLCVIGLIDTPRGPIVISSNLHGQVSLKSSDRFMWGDWGDDLSAFTFSLLSVGTPSAHDICRVIAIIKAITYCLE